MPRGCCSHEVCGGGSTRRPVRLLSGRVARHLVGAAAAALLAVTAGPAAWAQDNPASSEATTATLQQDKLRAEIRQIEQETAQASGPTALLLRVGPLATAIAALVTAGVAVNRHTTEQRARRDEERRMREEQRREDEKERAAQRRQREADRLQQEAASVRRFDEAFARTVAQLGSDSQAARASGAASLLAFLKPRHAEMVDDVLAIIVASLKLEQPDVVSDLLRTAFERAVPLFLAAHGKGHAATLDLARTTLARVDLEGADLTGISLDVAFADLSRANLTGLDLRSLRGYGVRLEEARLSRSNLQEARLNAAVADGAQFHDARLVSATFNDGASLRGAQFQQALLQSAHFRDADLRGARFEQANVKDAYFLNATLDGTARRSLLRTREQSWREAHLDPAVRTALETMSDGA